MKGGYWPLQHWRGGSSRMSISNLLNLCTALSHQAVELLHPSFNSALCIFRCTEEAISFAAQVAVVFCLLVQLEGRGEES